MKLRDRFRRLTLWNKLGAIGSLASILAILLGFIFWAWNPFERERSGELMEPKLVGVLMPGNDPDPPTDCGSPDASRIFLGNNVAYDFPDESTVLSIGGRELISLRVTENGLYLNATIIRRDGRLVGQLNDNEFRINPNLYFELERPSRHDLRVFDKDGQLALGVRYVNERTIEIEGLFVVPGYPPLHVREARATYGGGEIVGNCLGMAGGHGFQF